MRRTSLSIIILIAMVLLPGGMLAMFLPSPAAAKDSGLVARQGTLDAGGVSLWYRIAGAADGETVIFLHGGPGQGSQTFARFAGPVLERNLRMVYLDQRGSGRSDRPSGQGFYSIDRLVEDIELLRLALGKDRVSLIGHSFGSILAIEYAARYPLHVNRIVLAAAVPDLPALFDAQCERLAKSDPDAYSRAAERRIPGSAARCNPLAAYEGSAMRAYIDRNMHPDPRIARQVEETDTADGLGNTGELAGALFEQGLAGYRFTRTHEVRAPVLVIAGSADFQAVIGPQRRLVDQLPDATLLEYRGRGHFMFVEDPQRFATDVVAFLSGSPLGR